MARELAVLILNYNAKKYLADCINSLKKQKYKNFDIIIIDNASTDGSVRYLQKYFSSISIVETGKNLGYTGGYNYIFHYLKRNRKKYKYYLLLNPDTMTDTNLIFTLLKIFNSYKKVGIVVPSVLSLDNKIDSQGGKYLFLPGTTLGFHHGKTYTKGNHIFKTFWASGSALAIPVPVLEKVGYFNDYFMYYDDVDLSWRVNSAGYNVLSTDATYVKHIQGGSHAASTFSLFFNERNRVLCHWQNTATWFFYTVLPFFVLCRIVLLLRFTNSFSDVRAKLLGLFKGLLIFNIYPKNKFLSKTHVNVIKNMYTSQYMGEITI